MIKGINQAMVNRSIMKRGGMCNIIDNDTVERITIDVYELEDDDKNLYLYESQLLPIKDMVKKNRLCNMIETAGLHSSMSINGDLDNVGAISCINIMRVDGPPKHDSEFTWSIITCIDFSTTPPPFVNVFKIYVDGGESWFGGGDILTKRIKIIDSDTNLTDAKMAKITLVYN